jgi:hypothetical protein
MEDPARAPPPPFAVHLVTGGSSSLDLSHLLQSLAAARIVAFDAEWKPRRRRAPANGDDASPAPPNPPQLPTVTVLQLACRSQDGGNEVFVVDLLAVPLADLWAQLRDLFERPEVLKLGFRFKQDLVYLSATFTAALGCDYGFHKVQCLSCELFYFCYQILHNEYLEFLSATRQNCSCRLNWFVAWKLSSSIA